MTEDEAKTKWCPFASSRVFEWKRSADETVNAVWATPSTMPTTSCVGSACMAWRFGMKRNPDWKPMHHMMTGDGYMRHPDDRPPSHIADTETGFCGLAGAPQ